MGLELNKSWPVLWPLGQPPVATRIIKVFIVHNELLFFSVIPLFLRALPAVSHRYHSADRFLHDDFAGQSGNRLRAHLPLIQLGQKETQVKGRDSFWSWFLFDVSAPFQV
jgi:hypothetical protein